MSEANGNGDLTYPVGLLDATEASLAGSFGFARVTWLNSPWFFQRDLRTYNNKDAGVAILENNGYISFHYLSSRNGYNVKPTISLQPGIEYVSGDGSIYRPYVIDAKPINYKILHDDNILSSMDVASEGRTIKLSTTVENYTLKSFKMNGNIIKGDTFVMPAEDVVITDVVLVPCLESEHNPYASNLDEYKEKIVEGATSLTIELDCQTESTSYDYIYLYDSTGKQYGKYGGTTRKTETITIPGNYIKILFHTDRSGNNYYGYKATIIPNYD